MKQSRARINPRRRDVDLVRLAAALLDLSTTLDEDDVDITTVREIHHQITHFEERSA